MLGGGLEPPRLTAYAPQTYVSAVSPPERFEGTQLLSWTKVPASVSSRQQLLRSKPLKDSLAINDRLAHSLDQWLRRSSLNHVLTIRRIRRRLIRENPA